MHIELFKEYFLLNLWRIFLEVWLFQVIERKLQNICFRLFIYIYRAERLLILKLFYRLRLHLPISLNFT